MQVNTLAAEKLYSLAGDWAELGPHTLLFDVCCGTGTIGLTLAHRVGMVIVKILAFPNLVFKFPLVVKTCIPCIFIFLQVVGIEMNASAVLDAQRNAEINGIKNCRFVCSKVRIRAVIHIYLLIYII